MRKGKKEMSYASLRNQNARSGLVKNRSTAALNSKPNQNTRCLTLAAEDLM